MKKSLVLSLVLVLSSCGQGYAPLQLAADPTATPDMTLPLTNFTTIFGASTFTGFNSTTQGFQWQSNVITLNTTNVIAPVTGVISLIETGQTNSTNNVTIYFNARYSVKVTGITSLGQVRLGDYVTKGVSAIGQANYTSGVQVTVRVIVYQDGSPICPLTFFDSASRTSISQAAYFTASSQPCAI